jgi:hypothetical protein
MKKRLCSEINAFKNSDPASVLPLYMPILQHPMLPPYVFVLQQLGLPLGIVLQQTVLPGRVCSTLQHLCFLCSCLSYSTLAASIRICSTPAWAALGHCSTADCAAWTDMSLSQQPLLPLEVSVLLQSVCLLSSSLYFTIPRGTWPTAAFAAAKDVSV